MTTERVFEVHRLPGQFTLRQLREMARDKKLLPSDRIRRVGGSTWRTAEKVGLVVADSIPAHPSAVDPPDSSPPSAGDEAFVGYDPWLPIATEPADLEPLERESIRRTREPAADDQVVGHRLAILALPLIWILSGLKRWAARHAEGQGGMVSVGHVFFLAALACFFVEAHVVSLRDNSWKPMVLLAMVIVAAAVLQFLAVVFLNSATNLIRSSPTWIRNTAILDATGMILALCAAGCLLCACIDPSVRVFRDETMPAPTFIVYGLPWVAAGWILWLGSMCALRPDVVNVSRSDEASGGEEAVGLYSFFIKLLLYLAPRVYVAGSFLAAGFAGLNCYWHCFEAGALDLGGAYFNLWASSHLWTGYLIGFAGLFPLAAYLQFLLSYIVIDLLVVIFRSGRVARRMG